jgi:hypothetical protein
MRERSSFTRGLVLLALAAAGLALQGCVVQEQRPMTRIPAERATAEIPQHELLDVGIRIFDPNIPEDEKQLEKDRIFPDVRRAESRYIPVTLRDTLERTGYWGQVRVFPPGAEGTDLLLDGTILESNGRVLRLEVTAQDATGRVWYRKTYEGEADTRAYKGGPGQPADPFENLYNTIANDLLEARRRLPRDELVAIRQVSELRFAAELAPYAYGPYLGQDRKGEYSVVRLPAEQDPLMQRIHGVRERDYALIDTLNEHYAAFGAGMSDPYTNWRKYMYEELEAEAEAKRQALTRQLLGAAAVIGGVVAGSNSSGSAASAAATAAVIGGMYAFKSGFDMRAEVKMHGETLKQLGDSFQAEVQPMVVDVEGRTLQLKGSAEEQYAEWRRLLKELYENETGLPATVGGAADGSKPAAGRR